MKYTIQFGVALYFRDLLKDDLKEIIIFIQIWWNSDTAS